MNSFRRRSLTIAIRREQKGKWERRTPIVPSDISKLLAHPGCPSILVQPSSKRIFTDQEYSKVGCTISEDLSQADLILGIKEVPVQYLLPNKQFLFFSHTHKGQKHNMGALSEILKKNIHLMDYELLTDDAGRRLVAFGRHAGYAGMINALHGIGHRFLENGISTPLVHISRAYNYFSLDEAKKAINKVGREIVSAGGFPSKLNPVVFAFTGQGNVSQGAQEVFQQLPHEYITVNDLKQRLTMNNFHNNKIYGIQLSPQDYHVHKHGKPFDLQEYLKYGSKNYDSIFHSEIMPHITCLVHGSYWDERYPRLVTDQQMKDYLAKGDPKLLAIADISCDINGGIELTKYATTIDNPFLYYPSKESSKNMMVLAVDNLPAELSREASLHFSKCLTPILLEKLSNKDKTLERSTIAKNGKVVDRFKEAVMVAMSSKKKKVLLLGSGRVALPLVDFFLKKKNVELTIASNSETEIDSLINSSCKEQEPRKAPLDVSNEDILGSIIREHDMVISFVPAFLHLQVANLCVKHAKNLVTASYLSPEMAKLDAEAKKAGIIILNELGLDPGIDHLLAMEFIDQAKENGLKMKSFISWCGGLPAPENSNNPFGYKFSWSPRGVLTASMNPAIYKMNHKEVSIEAGKILDHPFDIDLFKGFNFEGIPNRDSLKYANVYGLKLPQLSSMFRGTLRFKGFSAIVASMRDVGLLDQQKTISSSVRTWEDVMANLLGSKNIEYALKKKLADKSHDELERIVKAFEFLGLIGSEEPVKHTQSKLQLDSLSLLMESKMKYNEHERDMVCLHHQFEVETNDGHEEKHESYLVAYGDEKYTAMAKTVALPAAYGAEMIMEGKLEGRSGVILPMTRDIYEPLLKQLRTELYFSQN